VFVVKVVVDLGLASQLEILLSGGVEDELPSFVFVPVCVCVF
jgi:hypothetical protein